MTGWRLSKGRYASPPSLAFDGEGSRRCGGRWSPPGMRVAYASSSLALASLEYFVNLSSEDAPAGLVSLRVEIPENVKVERVDPATLPENWRSHPFPLDLQRIGENWVNLGVSVCLLVPSAVVPED